MNLKEYLTPKQAQVLDKAGIKNFYDLITYLPSSLEEVKTTKSVNRQFQDESATYFFQGELISKVLRKTKAQFFQLQFRVDGGVLNAYFFSRAKFMNSMLEVGEEFQFLANYKKGFWNLKKISKMKKKENKLNYFKLGSCELKDYLIPVYSKKGILTNDLLRYVHERIPSGFYILNLQNLIPKNQNLIPEKINLLNIHHPSSQAEFVKTKNQYISLRVFLKLALMKKVNSVNYDFQAVGCKLDLEFLKQMCGSLPFELSLTQKQAILDILKEVSLEG